MSERHADTLTDKPYDGPLVQSRRGLFGLLAGALAAPKLAKALPAIPKTVIGVDLGAPGGDAMVMAVWVREHRAITSISFPSMGAGYTTYPHSVVTRPDRHG